MKNKYMEIALNEAQKSYLIDDVPVGAVIVKNNEVVAKAHNKREVNQSVIDHAEILAIQKACKKLGTWRLGECVLYTTLEPCLMCYGAIKQARISKVIYAVTSEKYGYTNYVSEETIKGDNIIKMEGIYDKKSQELLKNFFDDKRK